MKDGEAASIKYFTNGQGQQVFKSEPKSDQLLPDQSELGTGFINWLKTNFGWLYAQAQSNASLGSAYMYADGQLPSWAVLGEYDNGSASGTGRTKYLWLPTEDGGAVPVGMFRSSKFFAIHSDHLGTPRLMTDSTNKAVWQWPYSAFGNNKPTGTLKPTTSATGAFANQPVLLATQNPATILDLRFPGQMVDVETGLFYNYFRNYQPGQGRYTQGDPIGLDGGLNRFGYVGGNALSLTDPTGEIVFAPAIVWGIPVVIGATWWHVTNKRPRWPDRPNDDGKSNESWPKDNKNFCIRTYGNCVDYGWKGSCQSCLDRCLASGSGDWPFDMCKPKNKGDMCEAK